MKLKLAALAMAALLVGTTTSYAATIDFSAFSSGNTGLPSLNVGGNTFDVPGGSVYIYRPGDFGAFTDSGGVCALSPGGNCAFDWTLTFGGSVTNVSFESAFYGDRDAVLVQAYNGAALVGSVNVFGDGSFGFGALTITKLVFDDLGSTAAGFGFGDFKYDAASVPEPASLSLLGLAFAGFKVVRRRRR